MDFVCIETQLELLFKHKVSLNVYVKDNQSNEQKKQQKKLLKNGKLIVNWLRVYQKIYKSFGGLCQQQYMEIYIQQYMCCIYGNMTFIS